MQIINSHISITKRPLTLSQVTSGNLSTIVIVSLKIAILETDVYTGTYLEMGKLQVTHYDMNLLKQLISK